MNFEEFGLSRDSLPILLMMLLGFIFMVFGKEGDPTTIPNKIKKGVAVIAGIALGLLFMFYNAAINPDMQIGFVLIVKYIFGGFMLGANAIGLNQLMKGG